MNLLQVNPPLIAIVLLAVSVLLHYLIPEEIALRFPMLRTGPLISLAGGSIAISALFRFRRAKTDFLPLGEPTSLVVGGVYRFTRNPMYVGLTLILTGLALYVGSLPMFLAPVGFAVIIHNVFIPHEEEKMERIFGQSYRDFKARVRRWV